MKMKKIVDYIVLGSVSLMALSAAGIIMGVSHAKYQTYYNQNYPTFDNTISTIGGTKKDDVKKDETDNSSGSQQKEEVDPTENATLVGLSKAELKESIEYFDNQKALPQISDFNLYGIFKPNDGGEEFEHLLDLNKFEYEFSFPSTFYLKGGKISFTCQEWTTSITLSLTPVKLTGIEIVNNPYTVTYSINSTFDSSGLKVSEVYNDGTRKNIDLSKLTFSKTTLVLDDKEVVISYKGGSTTYETKLPIRVVENVVDGNIVSLRQLDSVDPYAYVNNGKTLSNATFSGILGVYESGNSKAVSKSDLNILNGTEIAVLGKKHVLDLELKTNADARIVLPVCVRYTFQAESYTDMKGAGPGQPKTEDEYTFDSLTRSFTKIGSNKHVGDFNGAVNNNKEASLTYSIKLTEDVENCSLIFKCANIYLVQNSDKTYSMRPIAINSFVDFYVNNEIIKISDDLILPGCGPTSEWASLYNVYSNITLGNLKLKGNNVDNKLYIRFKHPGIKAHWGNPAASMNIDWFRFESLGKQS